MQIFTKKVNKIVALLRKFQNILPRPALLTIYKYFELFRTRIFRTHLYYGDIIYDQAFNSSFHQKIESIQYNTAIFSYHSVIGEMPREKIYQGKIWNPFNKDIRSENYASFLSY